MEQALRQVVPVARASELARPEEARPCAASPEDRVREAAPPAHGRVYSKTRFVWIREEPDWGSQWVGYLWFGQSVPMKTGKPIFAHGCDAAWYEVEPRGYVCVGDGRVTLDPDDPQYRRVAPLHGDFSSASPHRYAESLGGPRYAELPSPETARGREPDLAAYLSVLDAMARGRVSVPMYAGADRTPATEPAPNLLDLPAELQVARWKSVRQSTVAHLGDFQHGSRSFLLTADLAWVPKERTRPYPEITFRGVRLDGSVHLPIAFFRVRDRPGYTRTAAGDFAREAGFSFPRLSWVPLTGREDTRGGVRYLETSLPGVWIRHEEAVVPTPSPRAPWGSAIGEPDPEPPAGRGTWIEASIDGGWLIAYEGTYPVYVTLASGGRGGPSTRELPLDTSSTPLGQFHVAGKFLSATMDGQGGVSHADVPWVLNFSGPYAIHGAYWHNSWGERMSGGCINVSPEDGKWLFTYAEPRLPPGWHGVRWAPEREYATTVIVRR